MTRWVLAGMQVDEFHRVVRSGRSLDIGLGWQSYADGGRRRHAAGEQEVRLSQRGLQVEWL